MDGDGPCGRGIVDGATGIFDMLLLLKLLLLLLLLLELEFDVTTPGNATTDGVLT
jgi:hypothetical protein